MRTAVYLVVMFVVGIVALAVPGWLYERREGQPLQAPGATAPMLPQGTGGGPREPLEMLADGLGEALTVARWALDEGNQSEAAHAMDAAQRAAEVGEHASPESAFKSVLEQVRHAREEIQNGRKASAARSLEEARVALGARPEVLAEQKAPSLGKYAGGTLIDAQGVRIGEVGSVSGDQVELILGGGRDFMGLFDLGGARHVMVPADTLVFGPARYLGLTLVAAPSVPPPGRHRSVPSSR